MTFATLRKMEYDQHFVTARLMHDVKYMMAFDFEIKTDIQFYCRKLFAARMLLKYENILDLVERRNDDDTGSRILHIHILVVSGFKRLSWSSIHFSIIGQVNS